jgi:hypothetical protein
LAFAGTALLRHDWKIRQLTQQLITQNNHIDIATGILTASLNPKTKLGENRTK